MLRWRRRLRRRMWLGLLLHELPQIRRNRRWLQSRRPWIQFVFLWRIYRVVLLRELDGWWWLDLRRWCCFCGLESIFLIADARAVLSSSPRHRLRRAMRRVQPRRVLLHRQPTHHKSGPMMRRESVLSGE